MVVLRVILTNITDCIEADDVLGSAGVDMQVKNKYWSKSLGCGTMMQLIQVKECVWNLLFAGHGASADVDEQVDDT